MMNNLRLKAVQLVLPLCAPLWVFCSACRHVGTFRVVPHSPYYLLRSPDSSEVPFSEVLRSYNGFEPGGDSIDLRPLMELRIENAYYRKGASRRGLKGFLGTEVARYGVTSRGLRRLSIQSMKGRPEGDVPVQKLIPAAKRHFRHYKLYFEIFFPGSDKSQTSVLLGANSTEELNRLSDRLTRPETVCNGTSIHCTVFPEACTVSVEMKIVVNGKSQAAVWGARLASVVNHPHTLTMERLHAGRLTPLEINPQDPNTLRLPLLPGDRVKWN